MRTVSTVPKYQTFEVRFYFGQGTKQDIDPLAPNNLAGIKQQVALVKRTDMPGIFPAADRDMDFDFLGVKTVSQQLLLHIIGIHHHPMAALVELDLLPFGAVTNEFEGQTTLTISPKKAQARKHA